MNREELKTILPHREPMLLLDEVTRQGDQALGVYRVRGDEFFLQGHFPGNPVVPGVILCEMLAQSACVLLWEQQIPGTLPMYTGLDQVKFRSPVGPGDEVRTQCSLTRVKHPFYFGEGTVTVDGRLCVSARFSFAVTGV